MGRVILAPALQKTRAATEAQYLLMKYVFEDLTIVVMMECISTAPSANAATRLGGLLYEGRFRNHAIYRCSRDTGSRLLTEGQCLRNDLRILSPENFDEQGQQKRFLRDC